MKALRGGIVGVLLPQIENELTFEAVEARIGGRGGRLVSSGFGGVAGAGRQG